MNIINIYVSDLQLQFHSDIYTFKNDPFHLQRLALKRENKFYRHISPTSPSPRSDSPNDQSHRRKQQNIKFIDRLFTEETCFRNVPQKSKKLQNNRSKNVLPKYKP